LSNYQIKENNSSCTIIGDSWEIEDPLYWTDCSTCSGNVASIKYSSCDQDFTLVTKTFTPNSSSINISFNYGYDGQTFYPDQSLIANLYDENTGTIVENLISLSTENIDNGFYSQNLNLVSGNNYTLRFNYIGNNDWGATIDNILVEETCGPSVTFTQTCDDVTNYDVTAVVNSLNGNYVNITNGSNTIELNAGTGTYIIENLTGSNTITVTNDIGCSASQNFSPTCDLCNNPSAPSDLPCDAPALDLSQPFFGTTDCDSYGVSYTGTNPGPDNLETSCFGNGVLFGSQNDSWLFFTAPICHILTVGSL
jgi:hypothetical protein